LRALMPKGQSRLPDDDEDLTLDGKYLADSVG
jgi:hypothetical protein